MSETKTPDPLRHIRSGPLMSQAVIHGNTVTLAGQVALDAPHASFPAQAEEIFARIDRLLLEAGTDRMRLVSATVWITNLAHFAEFNTLWIGWLDTATPPARASVRADLALPGLLLEIQVTAAL